MTFSGMDISEVARRSGLPASTLRHYEAKGLLVSVGRRGLHRVFEPGVLDRLALIALGRAAGFSLDEVRAMLAPEGLSRAGRPRIDRRRLEEKAEAVDRRIGELRALRDGLRHAAACPAPDHFACPSFQRLLRAAGRGLLPPEGAVRRAKGR